MTTLDRLYKKGLLARRKSGRPYVYSPRVSREDFERGVAEDVIDGLFEGDPVKVEPLPACIVGTVTERDRSLLDKLQALIEEKKRALDGEEWRPCVRTARSLPRARVPARDQRARRRRVRARLARTLAPRFPLGRRHARRRAVRFKSLPTAIAVFTVFGLIVPAYVAHEPRETDEEVGFTLLALALLSAAGVGVALRRLLGTWRATRRLARGWLRGAEPVRLRGVPVPAYKLPHEFPLVAVLGAFRPRLFVAASVLESLTPGELAAVVSHERGHLRARQHEARAHARLPGRASARAARPLADARLAARLRRSG